MKLRNKKTGEIISKIDVSQDNEGIWVMENKPRFYRTLAELNEEWEDYEKAAPLIKDERTRKAVRAWAEANDIERVWHEYSACWLRGDGLIIELENEVVELEQGNYSIDELCGEEDE